MNAIDKRELLTRRAQEFDTLNGISGAWTENLERADSGAPKKTANNIYLIVDNDDYFDDVRTEVHSFTVYKGKTPMTDLVYNTACRYIKEKYDIVVKKGELKEYIEILASTRTFNLFEDMLMKEPLTIDYDPIQRYFFEYLGYEYSALNYKLVLQQFKAAYARAINVDENGVKKDEMLVFYGGQGRGKTHLLEKLGGRFYTTGPALSGNNIKEAYQEI